MYGVPQSRDRRSFFMDLTLRRAKGFVQNKLRDLPWPGTHPRARPLVVSLLFNSLTQRRKGAKTRRVTGSDYLHNRPLNSVLVFLKRISVSAFAPLRLCAFALKSDCIITAGTPDLSGRTLNCTGLLPHECGVPPAMSPAFPFFTDKPRPAC